MAIWNTIYNPFDDEYSANVRIDNNKNIFIN